MLLLGLATIAMAADEVALTAGELRDNAFTVEKGEVTFHPLLRSHIGLTDRVDLKLPFLGEILGPRGSIELGLVRSDHFAFSVEPEVAFGWRFRTRTAGGTGRITFGGPLSHRLNVNAGAFYIRLGQAVENSTTGDVVITYSESVLVPVNVGFDLVVADRTTLRFLAATEALAVAGGDLFGSAGFNWNHAFGDDFRLSLGVVVTTTGLPDSLHLIGVEPLNLPPVLPLPTFELWWKL